MVSVRHDEKMWEDAGEIAKLVMFGAKGLRRWQWYQAIYRDLLTRVGRRTLFETARAEAYLALADGAEPVDAMIAVQKGYGNELRREWSYEMFDHGVRTGGLVYYEAYRSVDEDGTSEVLPLFVEQAAIENAAAQDSSETRSDVIEVLERVKATVTPGQWRTFEAVAAAPDGMSKGSPSSYAYAAESLGVAKGTIVAQMTRGRRRLKEAGVIAPSLYGAMGLRADLGVDRDRPERLNQTERCVQNG